MNDGYSETIALLRSSLSMSGCSVLQAHILDVLPKLAEQRARHYIKGAHGYFMGSWSDGNSGGSGGANSLKKALDKSGKGGIIELGSEGMFRRKDPNKIEPMPKKQLRRIERAFQRQGGVIQRSEAIDEYLEKRHAEGITYDAKTVLLRQNPGRASVFEGKTYVLDNHQKVEALKGIDLNINKGEIFGVIGLSGAGKSTLIRLINMLETPTEGRVIIDGEDITDYKEVKLRKVRKSIGMIFQQFNLLSSKTVFENVAFPLELDNTYSKEEIENRVTELLTMVGLEDKAEVYPAQLSGGQKQRVGIARALATNPKILLCDEATSALDPKTTSSILKLLCELRDKLSLTIVIITHQLEVIKECCDRVAVIDGGLISEMGNTMDLFANPQKDLTKRLVSAVVRKDLNDLLEYTKLEPEYFEGGKAWFELLFKGDKATDPVLVEVATLLNLKISIMGGQINHIQNEPLGIMVVAVEGSKQMIEKAFEEFQKRVYKVKLVGYAE